MDLTLLLMQCNADIINLETELINNKSLSTKGRKELIRELYNKSQQLLQIATDYRKGIQNLGNKELQS